MVELQHYFFAWEFEEGPRDFAGYYDNERDHESLDNVTPADVYFARQYAVSTERDNVKRLTMKRTKREYLAEKTAWVETENRLLAKSISSPKYFDDVHIPSASASSATSGKMAASVRHPGFIATRFVLPVER